MSPPAPRAPRRGFLRTSATIAVLASLFALVVGTGPAPGAAAATTTTVAATATATNVGAPSWWVGDCDATRWGPIAASKGWTGVGSHRMGATYLGVPVCGPRPSVDGSPDVNWGRAGWGESEWQCVELAQRFMAQVYGTKAYGANGSQVVNNYHTCDQRRQPRADQQRHGRQGAGTGRHRVVHDAEQPLRPRRRGDLEHRGRQRQRHDHDALAERHGERLAHPARRRVAAAGLRLADPVRLAARPGRPRQPARRRHVRARHRDDGDVPHRRWRADQGELVGTRSAAPSPW